MKKIKLIVAAILLLASINTFAQRQQIDTSNIYWEIIENGGDSTLVISGSGDMPNFASPSVVPWYSIRNTLKYLQIGDSITRIGQAAFDGCRNVTTLYYNAINCIHTGSYYPIFPALTTAHIGNNVQKIPSSLFSSCNELISVNIPNSVSSIGNYAFRNCSTLTALTIPNSVTSIGEQAFAGCSSLTSFTIPNRIDTIRNLTFSGCRGLTSIVIPDSVTHIEYSAFSGCSGLDSITIPDAVTSIKSSAFAGCNNLNTVYFNAINCIEMGGSHSTDPVFYGCSSLVTIHIGDRVQKIPNSAFNNCQNITSIVIPNSVTSIGASAFYKCYGIDTIVIPESITYIGNSAFGYCSNLTTVYFNAENCNTMEISINNTVFMGCHSLTAIRIGNNVQKIPNYAFYNTNITSVSMGNSVKTIGSRAFYNCRRLQNITIPNSVTDIYERAFYNCDNLTSVILGDSLHTIWEFAFYNCTNLSSIIIPDLVTWIHNSAFSGSGLSIVTLGKSVYSIGDNVFENCRLFRLTSKAQTPPVIRNNTFYNTPNTIPVHIPCGSLTRYENASWWNNFRNYTEETAYLIEVRTNDSIKGSTSASFRACDTVVIRAFANQDYSFSHWDDGNADNPRVVVLKQDTSFTAIFVSEYTVTATANDNIMGRVTGEGFYAENSMATLTAISNGGYVFENWTSNGVVISTDNPFSFVVKQDTALIANFADNVGIQEIELINDIIIFPNPAQNTLHIQSSSIIEQTIIYDINGKILKQIANPNQEINISDLASGIYLVKIRTASREVVRKIIKE